MIYKDYKRNHVILPGREKDLEKFLTPNNKKKYARNSHSEDALTWSCFDLLRNFSPSKKLVALDEVIEDSFNDEKKNKSTCNFKFKDQKYNESAIRIFIGKEYKGISIKKEKTEVDASIETPDQIIFFEAKLYSSISLADESKNKPHDQIARKLRVGLDYANHPKKDFYFIFLDIAPPSALLKFTKEKSKEKALDNSKDKWKSAWWFNYYKLGRNNSLSPLKKILEGIDIPPVEDIVKNMGWLTWGDLFKIVLRGMIEP
jgi:hypothetical protein